MNRNILNKEGRKNKTKWRKKEILRRREQEALENVFVRTNIYTEFLGTEKKETKRVKTILKQ